MHIITIIGIILIALGTGLTIWGQELSSSKGAEELKATVNSKNNKIEELVTGKNKLLEQNTNLFEKVSEYQNELKEKEASIEQLKYDAKKASRGVINIYDYNGARRVSTAGKQSVVAGEEIKIYNKMVKLGNESNFQDLLEVCKEQIEKTPEWLTPYVFLALASEELGDTDTAITYLEYVARNAPEDGSYVAAGKTLNELKNKRLKGGL